MTDDLDGQLWRPAAGQSRMSAMAAAFRGHPGFAVALLLHSLGRTLRLWLFEKAFRSKEWRQAVRSVRRDGYAIVPGYLKAAEIAFLIGVCERSAEGSAGLNGDPYFIATAPGSLRLRHMEGRHPEMDYFRRHPKLGMLSVCLYGRPHWPSVQYAATYDGASNPPYVAGRADAPFGGVCHVDQWHHQLKALFLLEDVRLENGPLMLFPGTWRPQWLGFDVYRLKRWNKTHDGPPPADLAHLRDDNFPPEVCAEVVRQGAPVPITGKAGDLVLFDARTLHFAGRIEKGRRRLLWFYY
jgi:hypothetical protein